MGRVMESRKAVVSSDRHVRGTRRHGRAGKSAAGWAGPAGIFLCVGFFLIATGTMPNLADRAVADRSLRTVRAAEGDSAWTIARRNPVAGLSTAAAAARICSLNHLEHGSQLQPGDLVDVPSSARQGMELAMR